MPSMRRMLSVQETRGIELVKEDYTKTVWRTNRKEDKEKRKNMFHVSMTYRNLDGVDMVAVDCHVEGAIYTKTKMHI